jgi:hypothetical protein
VLVAVQLSEPGLYLPPVFKKSEESCPPHIIISLSVQTAVCPALPVGAVAEEVSIQLSVFGLYLAPVFNEAIGVGVGVGGGGESALVLWLPRVSSWTLPPSPPHTIISLPVHTAV